MKITKRLLMATAVEALAAKGGWDLLQSLGSELPHSPWISASESNRRLTREFEAARTFLLLPGITREFEKLEHKFNLAQLTYSVCKIENPGTEGYIEGSGVLLTDKLIGLCAHETFAGQKDPMLISFNPGLEGEIKTAAELRHVDKEHDVAIAELVMPNFAVRNSLIPVKRRTIGYDVTPDQPTVCLGFLDGKLHAVEMQAGRLTPAIQTDAGPMKCKMEATSKIATWGGMSGGGVFDADNTFFGIHNAGNLLRSGSLDDNTPADLIWAMVDALDNRAVIVSEPQTPEACRLNRRDFFNILGKE